MFFAEKIGLGIIRCIVVLVTTFEIVLVFLLILDRNGVILVERLLRDLHYIFILIELVIVQRYLGVLNVLHFNIVHFLVGLFPIW